MDKYDVQILVIKRSLLFPNNAPQGFIPTDTVQWDNLIQENTTYMRRGDAEIDTDYKQLIPYVAIVNPSLKQVYTYKRSSGSTDARLHYRYSFGIGGHIDQHTDEQQSNPILAGLQREIEEETGLSIDTEPTLLGYINDDSESVGQVHLGLFYILETDKTELQTEADKAEDARFMSISALKSQLEDPDTALENWSKICFPVLERYFS